ncbi:MAG: hypothetical protein WD847_07070 [Pirellulales bacterium]
MSMTRMFWRMTVLSCHLLLVTPADARGEGPRSTSQREETQELVEHLSGELGLDEIPPERGGGYLVDTRFGNGCVQDMELLGSIERVRAFYFNDEFSSEGWALLARHPGLEVLKCTGSGSITDADLACLQKLTGLRELALESEGERPNRFSERSLEALPAMHRLERLVLEGEGVNDAGLDHVRRVTSLVSLKLAGRFTDEGVARLSGLKDLRVLVLRGEFTDEGLVHVAQLRKLEALVIWSDRLTGAGLSHLAGLDRLTMLKFVGSRGGEMSLQGLEDWPALEALNLASSTTDDALLATLGELPRLKSLSLQGASITDEGLAALSGLTSLEELDLQFTNVTSQGIRYLLPLKGLRILVLGHPHGERLISDEGVRLLAKLPDLEQLNMVHADLGGGRLQHLAQIKSLRNLNVEFKDEKMVEDWKAFQALRPDIQRVQQWIRVKAFQPNFPTFGEIEVLRP